MTEVESKLRVYIGCPEDTNKKGSVFAYFEDTALNTMKLESKVILDSLSEGDLFGSSISADGYDLVVGASHFDIPNTSNSGAFFGFYQK